MTTTARPTPGRAFFCPPGRQAWAAMPLYSPAAPRRLCAVLRPAGGIFAPVSNRAEHAPKRKTAVKAICRLVTAFYSLMAIPIFPRHQVAHSGPQTAKQGIKQPRPAPSWSKPGLCHLFRAMDSTAQRLLSASNHAHIWPTHLPAHAIFCCFDLPSAQVSLHKAPIGQIFILLPISSIVATSKKSFHSCLHSRKSPK